MSLLTELHQAVKRWADKSAAPVNTGHLPPEKWDVIAQHLHNADAGLREAEKCWKDAGDVAGEFALDLARQAADLALRARWISGTGADPRTEDVEDESPANAVEWAEERIGQAHRILLAVPDADKATARFRGDLEILQDMVLSLLNRR